MLCNTLHVIEIILMIKQIEQKEKTNRKGSGRGKNKNKILFRLYLKATAL